jgi:hypothetical protein
MWGEWALVTSWNSSTRNSPTYWRNFDITSYPAFMACANMWAWWRLPTIEELKNLRNNNWKDLLQLAGLYWSSTHHKNKNYIVWILNVNDGLEGEGGKYNLLSVTCVHN